MTRHAIYSTIYIEEIKLPLATGQSRWSSRWSPPKILTKKIVEMIPSFKILVMSVLHLVCLYSLNKMALLFTVYHQIVRDWKKIVPDLAKLEIPGYT